MVLPVAAGLGLRGLMSLLGRSGAGKGMQSAMGRALGNKKMMPFAGAKQGSAELTKLMKPKPGAGMNKTNIALLSLLGLPMLAKAPREEEELAELLMGPREPNELEVEDLIMQGGTNKPVTTGGENDFSYATRGDMEFDEFGQFIKPQDRMPDTGEVDLLKLLGLR
tara:strand:+ start:383 stop:880 length:498 start_codon:yes stop_codon:yes gene_type:complete